MAMTRSKTRKQNQDECSRKKSKTCKNGGTASWADLCHDVLFLILLKLGIEDYVPFSGVCKATREVAQANKNMFTASRKPMTLSFSTGSKNKECYLKELKGRMFMTILPRSNRRTCIGVTCGYMIFFGRKNRDFNLVNPITKHVLHFPPYPFSVDTTPGRVRAVLVFSPSLSGFVLVIAHKLTKIISFSISKQFRWKHITSGFFILDLHAFQGKIYALSTYTRLCEVRLNPEPTLTLLLETRGLDSSNESELVRSGERLFVFDYSRKNTFGTHGIDFKQMKWVTPLKRTLEEHTFLLSEKDFGTVSKLVIWDDIRAHYERFGYFNDSDNGKHKGKCICTDLWYLPRDCLDVTRLHE